MNSKEFVASLLIALGFAVASLIQDGVQWSTVRANVPTWATVLCFFCCYFTIKAARSLHKDDLTTWKEHKPIIHGDDRRPKRPSGRPWTITAALVCTLWIIAMPGVAFLLVQPENRTATEPLSRANRELRVLFTESPLSTPERQKRIANELESFYQYLKGLGFNIPREMPLIDIWPGNWHYFHGLEYTGSTAYELKFVLGTDLIDNPGALNNLWATYVFGVLFDRIIPKRGSVPVTQNKITSFVLHMNTVGIFALYYRDSFNGTTSSIKPGQHPWNNALWDIREALGQDFTDKALFYTFTTFQPAGSWGPDADFNDFFKKRFWHGVMVLDSLPNSNRPTIDKILESYDL